MSNCIILLIYKTLHFTIVPLPPSPHSLSQEQEALQIIVSGIFFLPTINNVQQTVCNNIGKENG